MTRKGGSKYTEVMLGIYSAVTAAGVPNYRGTRIQLPTNLCLSEWARDTWEAKDSQLLDYLTYGFPVSYRGPIPTANAGNHASATQHPDDVRKYVNTEVAEGQC